MQQAAPDSLQESSTELVPADDPRASVISIDLERMSGAAVFAGTRVPIRSLFEHLAAGDSLSVFLDDFQGVPRSAEVRVLELAADQVLAGLPKAGE